MNTHFYKVNYCATGGAIDASGSDIHVELDQAGFVVHTSHNAVQLGIDPQSLLLMPHVADLAVLDHQSKVTQYFQQVIAGDTVQQPVVFPLHQVDPLDADNPCDDQHWYSLKLRRIDSEAETSAAAIGTLQPVQQKHSSPRQYPIGAINDPFTGLADRRCFVSSLVSSIATHEIVSVAVFAIDGMRAIFMQYGQGTADEIRWGFARFLEAMAEPHHSLAQIDEERFGIILPDMRPKQAREWASEVLNIFAGLAMPATGREPELRASAGITGAELNAEWTIRQAELGLVMARSGGGMQAAVCQPHSCLSSGQAIERAMEGVVERTAKRLP
ncbi:MAG: GGDEF domain-containing protein [Pseudomonadota bacterium]